MKRYFYRRLEFFNSATDGTEMARSWTFSKDALVTKLQVFSPVPLTGAHEMRLRLNSESFLAQNPFVPHLFSLTRSGLRVHIPVRRNQTLSVTWKAPQGRGFVVFAFTEDISEGDFEEETYLYVRTADRRDGITILQPNIQKNYLWEGFFLYDSFDRFSPVPAEWVFPSASYPWRPGGFAPFTSTAPGGADDLVQVRDFPSEFRIDFLPRPAIGGHIPGHLFRDPVLVKSQTLLNIAVSSKTKTSGTVTGVVLGRHVAEARHV